MKIINLSISIRLLFCLLFLSSYCFSQEEIIKLQEANITKKSKKSLHYEELKKMPRHGLYDFGYTIHNDILYVMNGDISESGYKGFNNEIYSYDFKNDIWKTLNSNYTHVANNYVFSYNNLLYNFGGRKRKNSDKLIYINDQIDAYDIIKDTIYTSRTMPHQAVNSATVRVNNNILLFGGSTSISKTKQKFYTNKVHFFDIKTGSWYQLNNMPEAKETTGILVNNKIFLVGGHKNKPLKKIESYDLTNGKWQTEAELPIAIEKPSLATKDNIIYIYDDGIFFIYNTLDKTFSQKKVNNIQAVRSTIFIKDEYLYILGGYSETHNGPAIYTETSDTFYRINLKENFSLQNTH